MANLSPMMKQYLELKKEYPNTLLFFRLGDFYEMFFEDAKTASRELELTLTGRDCGLEERAPMCGVPYHSYENYVARLVAKGYKVAICEQMEDPAMAKGIVKRDVVRVITPGTILENSMLDEARNNFICAVCVGENETGVCFADVSTGTMHATALSGEGSAARENRLCNELARFMPRELLMNPQGLNLKHLPVFARDRLSVSLECLEEADFDFDKCQTVVCEQFRARQLEELGLEEKTETVCAAGALLGYLARTQRGGLERLTELSFYKESQFMRMDANTRRNLELLETMRSQEKKGSLLWVLDKTKTAMGKRLIRNWIIQPLISPTQITRRLNAVEELKETPQLRDGIVEQLSGIFDLERIMTRIVYGSANGRELRALCATLERLPALKMELEQAQSTLLQDLFDEIDVMTDVRELIDAAIVEEPPFTIREGGVIRPGYHETLDQIKSDMANAKELIAAVETRERERTKIPKLKIGYNRVFGYYIEISNSYKNDAPADYIRKQTLTNGERFITQELKELENRILGASDKAIRLETELFEAVRKQVAGELGRVQRVAHAVAQLDVLVSFAVVSAQKHYVRPEINLKNQIQIAGGRHPVVENLLDMPFVPNDTQLDMEENRVAIITGPNMAGKSTYMRQTALIVLLAQIGCFVPADSAKLSVVDAIFTRVGASDDLASGQSTFMVEMTEVADILRYATNRSLIIFDEIGRGTSTFDGMSIARAVLEYVADPKTLGAKTMFATHYHELTELEEQLSGVKNYNIAVKKRGDDITFLRRIVRGGADDSYGIEVAKLAGVPEGVIRRAKRVLADLEAGRCVASQKQNRKLAAVSEENDRQLTLSPSNAAQIRDRLRQVDVNTLTPLECMNLLFELVKLAKENT